MHATTLGERIALARGRVGLTQGELSEAVGAKRNAVSAWERDKSQPEGRFVRKLLEVLDVDANWLFLGYYRNGGDVTLPSPEALQELFDWLDAVLEQRPAKAPAGSVDQADLEEGYRTAHPRADPSPSRTSDKRRRKL